MLEAFFAEMEMNASEKSSQDDSSSDSDQEVSYQHSLFFLVLKSGVYANWGLSW